MQTMMRMHGAGGRGGPRRHLRVQLAIAWVLAAESLFVALAAAPAVGLWIALLDWRAPRGIVALAIALSIVPMLVVFALLLMPLSAYGARLMRWRTPEGANHELAALEWPVLRWACYAACTHVVGLLAGPWLRGSPVWSWYLRANGARVGRGVYVNSLKVGDHNLLEIGDGAVIGSDAHVSGHVVEHGRLLTGRVRIGARAVVGLQSMIAIDVDVGADAQVAALSVVPKHARLEAGATYGGVPARRLDRAPSSPGGADSPPPRRLASS